MSHFFILIGVEYPQDYRWITHSKRYEKSVTLNVPGISKTGPRDNQMWCVNGVVIPSRKIHCFVAFEKLSYYTDGFLTFILSECMRFIGFQTIH